MLPAHVARATNLLNPGGDNTLQRQKNNSTFNKFYSMTLIGFLVLLLIAAICGAIGQSLAGYNLGGCLMSIIVGFIGAYIGLWIAGKFGLPQFFTISVQGQPFPVVWAVIGSAIFTLLVALIRRTFTGRDR